MFSQESFHIHLYGSQRIEQHVDGPEANVTARNAVSAAPLPTSFEEAQERLGDNLPAVLMEPDGSLAWAGRDHQIVGMIYDAGGQVQYVELRGHASRERLRELVRVLSGCQTCDDFAVMVLPGRQWKNFQSFAMSL